MTKYCVCTLHFNDYNNKYYSFLKEYAIPTIEAYAKRVGADFVLLDKNTEIYRGSWNQLRCLELLDSYDKIMYIDGDCFISESFSENIFDKVPYGCIGMEKHPNKEEPCNNIFSILVIGNEYRGLFTSVVPKKEHQVKSTYPCMFGVDVKCTKQADNARLQREECLINQIIYKNKLNNKVIDMHEYFVNDIEHATPYIYNNGMSKRYYMFTKLLKLTKNNDKIKYYGGKEEMKKQLFYPNVSQRMIDNAMSTLDSKWIAQGPQVKLFEERFAEEISGHYPIATNSTTGALHLAYLLSDIQEGDEVITTVFTCTATNIPLLWMKANIVFADIQKETLNIDPKDVERKISNRTKAIVCMNYSGYPCELEHLRHLADKHNCKLICDNAHGIKTMYKGKRIEDWCDYVIYSFQAIKFITTADGGMVVTKDKDEAKLLKKMRWFGIDKEEKMNDTWDGKIDVVGYKYHMNDLSASMGLAALETLDDLLASYKHKYNLYKSYFEDLLIPSTDDDFNSWLMTVRIERDLKRLMHYLKENNIESGQIHFRNDQYDIFGGKKLELPNMDAMENSYLVLPMNNTISDDDIEYISSCIL